MTPLIAGFIDYSKLPPSPPIDQVFLLDPLIATGGTACAALGMIVEWGIPGTFLYIRLASQRSIMFISEGYQTIVYPGL